MEDLQSQIQQAKQLYETCHIEEAYQLYLKAFEQMNAVASAEALDAFADLAATLGDSNTAITAYRASISHKPHCNPSKYFALAQLLGGAEALQMDVQGIAEAAESAEGSAHAAELAKAHAAVAELFMTDLCDEPLSLIHI